MLDPNFDRVLALVGVYKLARKTISWLAMSPVFRIESPCVGSYEERNARDDAALYWWLPYNASEKWWEDAFRTVSWGLMHWA